MIYTVTLNPALDYVVFLPGELKVGDLNRNRAEEIQYGGKGINVSGVLKELGCISCALGFIAGFTGEGLERGLREMGLLTDFIRVREGMTRINVKVKAGKETEINGIGPKITDEDMGKLYGRLEKMQAEDILILSGSVPGSLPENTYEQILHKVEVKGIRTVVDASGKLLLDTLPYHPFLIKPNLQELEEIFDTALKTDEAIASCARKLQEMGAVNVLVSMAGDGALLLDENERIHRVGCPEGTVVNSVGAGDSMVAGFVAGYTLKKDYGYALKLGTAAGSATAFSSGLSDRKKIEELFARIEA